MHALQRGDQDSKPPIAMRRVRIEPDPLHGWTDVIVEFDHVQGNLHCGGGRPSGFSIIGAKETQAIYDVILNSESVLLRCGQPPAKIAAEFQLHYGRGLDPLCNITNDHDRSLSVFGPLRLDKHADGYHGQQAYHDGATNL